MRAEVTTWHATPKAIDLARFQEKLPLGVRLDLTLLPNTELKFPVAPKRAPKPDWFGGLAAFEVPKDGPYRVSAGGSVWIEVVETVGG
jgi:hypothetical protein